MKPDSIKDERDLATMSRKLARQDRVLNGVYQRLGPPPLWSRKPGIATLVHIVLEQQVSLASGRAAFKKLKTCCQNRVTANRIIDLGEQGLRQQARMTRQKAGYVLEIARATKSRKLNFNAMESMSNESARQRLMEIKGIGVWTSDVYLMMALCRSDILPMGDLALEIEIAKLCKLNERPSHDWLQKRAERWRPFRAAAARMIWHSYLDRLGRHDEI